jgi:hypothetical protein
VAELNLFCIVHSTNFFTITMSVNSNRVKVQLASGETLSVPRADVWRYKRYQQSRESARTNLTIVSFEMQRERQALARGMTIVRGSPTMTSMRNVKPNTAVLNLTTNPVGKPPV